MNRFLLLLTFLLATTYVYSFQTPTNTAQNILITDADLQGGQSYTWTKDTIYTLSGSVVLEAGAVLNIEPGTVILAKDSASLTIANEAQIFAEGTSDEPILMTTEAHSAGKVDLMVTGVWGGLKIAGSTGFNSGILSYISIRHAGQNLVETVSAGLVLEAVDQQTALHHIDVFASGTDGIQINGGTANLSHITTSFSQDDGIEWGGGWQGNGIYWFLFEPITSSEPSFDGTFSIVGKGGSQTVKSNPTLYNITVVANTCGLSRIFNENYVGKDGAIYLTEQTQGLITNSVFTGFRENGLGLKIEDIAGTQDTRQELENGNLIISNNVWGQEVSFEDIVVSEEAAYLIDYLEAQENFIKGPGVLLNATVLCQIDRFYLDPRIDPLSDYRSFPSRSFPTTDFFTAQTATQQKGAFPTDDLWIANWAALNTYSVLGDQVVGTFLLSGKKVAFRDTIHLPCTQNTSIQGQLTFREETPCTAQGAMATRKTNRKRRPITRSTPEEGLAYIEEWRYEAEDRSFCPSATRVANLVIMYYDTIAPIIHLIPDERGRLSAYAEDCDEASITSIQRDTFDNEGILCVNHTFVAMDYVGNTSSLTIQEKLVETDNLWYPDFDGDFHGNPAYVPIRWADPIPGFVPNNGDCDDFNPTAIPISGGGEAECLGPIIGRTSCTAPSLAVGVSQEYKNYIGIPPFPTRRNLISDCASTTKGFSEWWFQVNVPESGNFSLTFTENQQLFINPETGMLTSFNTQYIVELYEGNCQNMSFLECFQVDDYTKKGFTGFAAAEGAAPAIIYGRIVVFDNTREGILNVTLNELEDKIANDICATAELLLVQPESICTQFQRTNMGADALDFKTDETCNIRSREKSAWLSFVVPDEDTLDIEIDTLLDNTFKRPFLQVYRGDCDSLVAIACSPTESGFSPATAQIVGVPTGEVLYLKVVELGAQDGDFRLRICQRKTATNSVEIISAITQFKLLPNPIAREQAATIRLNLKEKTSLDIQVLNLQGQIIQQVIPTRELMGTHTFSIATANWGKGLYLVQLRTATGVLTRKLIVQ